MVAVRNKRSECETIIREEVGSAVRKMKCGKAAGVDSFLRREERPWWSG